MPPPDTGETDGWRYVSQPTAVRRVDGGMRIERLRHVIAPGGERTTAEDVIVLAAVSADELEARGRRRRPAGAPGPLRGADRRPRRLRGGAAAWLTGPCACARCIPTCSTSTPTAATCCCSSAAARGAASASSCPGPGLGEALDPDAHDLFYIGGGQDRDQARCALGHGPDQARRAPRRGRARRRRVRRLRRLPAARARLRHGRRDAARASASSTSRRCARTGRG